MTLEVKLISDCKRYEYIYKRILLNKTLIKMIRILVELSLIVVAYFFGANNPWASVKAKIAAAAKAEVSKVIK